MAHSKDLFDDTTMSFGEHLEILRIHLWRAVIGLVIGTMLALFFGNTIVGIVRAPIDSALHDYGIGEEQIVDAPTSFDFWGSVRKLFAGESIDETEVPETPEEQAQREADELVLSDPRYITLEIPEAELRSVLGLETMSDSPGNAAADTPDAGTPEEESPPAASAPAADNTTATADTPAADDDTPAAEDTPLTADTPAVAESGQRVQSDTQNPSDAAGASAPKMIKLLVASDAFVRLERVFERQNQAVTLTVQEAFMTYLKVALISGLVLSSPWVFYQIWLFVAAGLYPHERKYVHIYLPVSIVLFLGGAVFCFYMVFPFVLSFLLSFNQWLDVQPQIRLSEWISFAIMLPVMFGLSFQLPLVMLFLERISVFGVDDYRSKRRMSVLVIAIVAMFLTPADPMSMLLMMLPLVALYELGIYMCQWSPVRRPFEEPEAI